MKRLRLKQIVEIIKDAREKGKQPNLSYLDLRWSNLNSMDLHEVDFSGANLYGINLVEADLSMANICGANLVKADLRLADLRGADLSRADLSDVNLGSAQLRRAKLNKTHLSNANLKEADLSKANLNEVYFSGVDLTGANLTLAEMRYNAFGNIDLRGVKGLDTVKHTGPSHISIDTIYRSRGQISEVFLRGAGVPDTFITYLASLTGEAIQYYSCFISYSSKDENFAQRLHADLQQKGVRCWFAPEDMKIGDKIRHTIDQSIRIHDKLLLILSENSLNSEWVESEVEKAFEEERQRKQTVLFPVRLDEAVMETDQPWAAEIRRTRHIGDFTRWKDHDTYQMAFERLLRDLKAESNL